jgi:hypothetical protein
MNTFSYNIVFIDGIVTFSPREISQKFDIKETIISTYLVLLELDELIKQLTPIYCKYSFKLNENLDISDASKIASKELKIIFSCAKATRKKGWYELDVEEALKSTDLTRSEMINLLEDLCREKKIIEELDASIIRHRIAR